MKLENTRLTTVGVFRCCGDVASEYVGKEVEIGFTSKCQHCGEMFTLVHGNINPLWVPNRQIERKTKNQG